jgi:predicted ATP-dependent serine protease
VRTLYRAISGKEVGGEPLPLTFKSLQQNEIVLRRAELNLIAGTPGAGKSSIALAIAVQAQVPTLYMSADTNAHTMGMRVVAMATGMTQSNAEQILKQDKDSAENILKQFDYLRWSFESSPTLSDIDESVQAFETTWGTSPTLIVVDNLMDIAMDGHEEFSGMRAAMKELKYLARDTNACVLVLHHTKEGFIGTPCQPRSAIQGLVNQIPALILTIGQEIIGESIYLCVAAVKNRYGRADATGNTFTMLSFDPASMQLKDVKTSD